MSGLFRQQAIDAQRREVFGRVTIHQPVAFGYITGALVLGLLGALAFAANESFSKRENALGWVSPEGGLAQVYAPQGSLIQSVSVRVGQTVAKGQVLASLSTDTYDATGATGDQERQQLAAQQQELDAQILASRTRLTVYVQRAREQDRALRAGVAILADQRRLQVAQLGVAQSQFDDAAPLVKKGFISKFDQDRRQQEILSLKQAISGIDRQIRDQEAQIEFAQSDLADATARQATEEAQLLSSKANLRSSRIGLDYRTGATLRAPVAGTVASINNQPGETAQPSLAVVSIAPPGNLEAELLLPTRSAGLVQHGQSVRLFVDAFPYQRYGAIEGVVDQIGRAAVSPAEYVAPIAFKEPSYRIRVRILKGLMPADRSKPILQAGMTLTAIIVADKRTILEWLTDPLRGR